MKKLEHVKIEKVRVGTNSFDDSAGLRGGEQSACTEKSEPTSNVSLSMERIKLSS